MQHGEQHSGRFDACLANILRAQGFRDLTAQAVAKVVTLQAAAGSANTASSASHR